MKRRLVVLAALSGLQPIAATPAAAHSAVWARADTEAVTFSFAYSDGTAMSYADVVVVGPGGGPQAQNGRTDRNGRFAFVPDRDGQWQVRADDGQGHVVTAHAEVANSHAVPAATGIDPFQNSLLHDGLAVRTLGGLSLIANLGLAALLVQRRRGTVRRGTVR